MSQRIQGLNQQNLRCPKCNCFIYMRSGSWKHYAGTFEVNCDCICNKILEDMMKGFDRQVYM